jgi:methyl-accepting chemotaxis protein
MKAIGNMKVGTRLGLGFAALLALQLVTTGIGLRQMADLADNVSTITEVGEAKLKALNEVSAAIGARAIAARNIALLTDPAAQKPDLERVKVAQTAIDKGVAELSAVMQRAPESSNAEERAMLEKLRALEGQYLPLAGRIVGLATSQKTEEAVKALTQECMPLLTQVIGHVAAFNDLLKKESDASAAVAQATYQRAKWLLVVISAVSLVLGGLVAWLLTRSITRPLHEAVQVARRVADGDLTTRIDVKNNDESGQLLAALKQMNDSLVKVVGNVRQASDSISTGSTEIAAGNQDLSSRTEQQASALEETAASMEELGATVRQNADNAKQANQLAQNASTVAVRGGDAVGQVVETMKGINESSRKIADIISVIDGIAFQTNILALNAAVEAARAGEQGRGFAVVASEVRSLAQRSADAAKEIKALISASVERVEQGTVQVDQAGATMTEVVTSIKRVTDIMAEISAASTEQSAGVAQVGDAVTEMDKATQQNAALVEQSAAAAESLRNQAKQLVAAVAVFKLAHDGRPHVAAAPAASKPAAPAASFKPAAPTARPRAAVPTLHHAVSVAAAPAAHVVAAPAPIERRGPNRATNVVRPTFAPATPTAMPAGAPSAARSTSAAQAVAKGGTDDWESF